MAVPSKNTLKLNCSSLLLSSPCSSRAPLATQPRILRPASEKRPSRKHELKHQRYHVFEQSEMFCLRGKLPSETWISVTFLSYFSALLILVLFSVAFEFCFFFFFDITTEQNEINESVFQLFFEVFGKCGLFSVSA